MKKTLLLLSALLLSLGTFAQDVTLDFSTNTWGLPEGASNKGTTEAEFTNGTYTIKLEGANGYYWFSQNSCLLMGKKDAKLTLPTFTSDVEKIVVTGPDGASGKTTQNIFVGDNEASTETTGAKGENTYEIGAAYQAAGNQYVLKVTNTNNTQIIKIDVYYKSATSLKPAELKFSESSISLQQGEEFTAPTFTKATTADVKFASSNEEVATVSAEGVIALAGGLGKATVTATSEANEEYAAGETSVSIEVYKYNNYVKVTKITDGKQYLLVAQRNDSTLYAYPLTEGYAYGYIKVGIIKKLTDQISIKSTYDDSFTFTADEENTYSIKDCYGRYYFQKDTYNSFNTSTEYADTYLWTVTPQADGTFQISQNGYTICWGTGTFTTFAAYETVSDGAVLPYLYQLDEDGTLAGISNMTAEKSQNEKAPMFNLAGQQVSKSYKGVVIQNGKKFINK